ncbi:MAG: carbohydrate ABC transporter permease [Deinococcales bacterium]
MTWRRILSRALAALVVAALFAFPFYWVVATSLNSESQALAYPPVFLPHFVWANYVRAWVGAPWIRYFLNTILIASATTSLVLLTSILAGYAFGGMRWPGRRLLFGVVLSILLIPVTVLIVPDYILLHDLHWLNTYQAQIVPWGASVFGIFLLRQFFAALPIEYWEAAQLDGAGRFWFLWRVAVPMAVPVLITIAVYIFLGSWNSFLWPFIMTQTPNVQPVEVGLATFLGTNGTDWTGLSAAVVFTTLPVMLLFLVAQRQFVSGISGGGLKE